MIFAFSGREISLPVLAAVGASPTLVGIFFIYKNKNPVEWRRFWKRVINFRLIRAKWYLVIFLLFPMIFFSAIFFDIYLSGNKLSFQSLFELFSKPLELIYLIVITFIFGPLTEELGWRGYALDRLQSRWNALFASLVLGFLCSFWHLPVFFIKGTFLNYVGLGSLGCLQWFVATISMSVIFTWIYNNNHQSILSAILIHFWVNFTVSLTSQIYPFGSIRILIFRIVIFIAVAFIIILIFGYKTMTKKRLIF